MADVVVPVDFSGNPSASTPGGSPPASAMQVGVLDAGGNLAVPRTHNLATAGTENNVGVNLRQTGPTGSIEVGLPYGSGAPLYTSDQMLEVMWRKAMLAALNHQLAFDATGARIRVYCNAGTLDTVTTVTTVGTVTTLNQLGGVAVRDMLITPTERNLWANGTYSLFVP